MIERIVSRGLDAPVKFAPVKFAPMTERIVVIKNSHTYCKNLKALETKYYTHTPRGEVGRS